MSTFLKRSLWIGSLLALLAFGLRAFELSRQSFWYDEAFSVYLARFDLATITARTAADIQPPLYYYLLNLWMAVAGDSEFAVRFLSLLFGFIAGCTAPRDRIIYQRYAGYNYCHTKVERAGDPYGRQSVRL